MTAVRVVLPTERMNWRTIMKRLREWYQYHRDRATRNAAAEELDRLYDIKDWISEREPVLVRIVEEFDQRTLK